RVGHCSVSCSSPACRVAACVDVHERAMRPVPDINSTSPYQRRVLTLNAIYRSKYHARVSKVDPAVVIQVTHTPGAIVVDVDVGGVAVHVAAQRCPPTRIAASAVVLWSAKSAHHVNPFRIHAMRAEIIQHQLELVHQLHADHHVFGPHVALIVREEILDFEVL